MSTPSSKKGKAFERFVRDAVREAFSMLEDGDIIGQIGAGAGEDLILSPLAKRTIGHSFECKSYQKIAIYKWWNQCTANAEDRHPALVMKANHQEPLVAITLKHFLELIK